MLSLLKTMSFHQRHKERSYTGTISICTALGLLVYIVVIQPAFLTNTMRAFGLPFLRMRASASDTTSIFGKAFAEKESLVRENNELKEKIVTLQLKGAMYDELKAQYDDLLKISESEDTLLLARVLSTPRTAGYDVLLLDIGIADGVSSGVFVVGQHMVVLGRLEAVGEHSSRAVLFSAPESEIAAVLPKNGLDVTAYGQGGGMFMVQVPQETEVEVGDAITLRALPGKLLAVVSEVSVDPTDAFKTVYATVPLNIFNLRHVGVRR